MKRAIAGLVEKLPGTLPFKVLNVLRSVRYPSHRHAEATHKRLFEACGRPDRVLQGPFKGMTYVSEAYFGYRLPKILGTYEMELADLVERSVAYRPDRVIDIGAAEGYYAVGLAVRNPQAHVVSFELYAPANRLIAKMADLNGVRTRLTLRGAATTEALNEELDRAARPFVVIDVEGYEDVLMDPARSPALRRALILIEVHECYVPDLPARLRERFAATHTVTEVLGKPKTAADLPPGVPIAADDIVHATNEGRDRALWFYLEPKS